MVTNEYVIGVDLGTGGCKVTVLSRTDGVVGEAYRPYPSHYEHPGWVEQDPNDWVTAAVAAVTAALTGIDPVAREHVAALIFSAPHHTAVLLDADGAVVRRAILWNDQRSKAEAEELKEQLGEHITRVAHNTPAPTWTLPQMLWLSRHEPESLKRARQMLYMKDYVRFAFSGRLATDHIDASGTLFWDIHTRDWDPTLLAFAGIDHIVQPEVLEPGDQAGELTAAAAEKMGLPEGIPVLVGTADTAAEVFGSGGVADGQAVIKLATAGNFAQVTSALPEKTGVISYEHPIQGLFYANAATNFAAASFRWFRENFLDDVGVAKAGSPRDLEGLYERINREVAEVEPGCGGLIFHPYLNGERSPLWDPDVRGSFFGISAAHTRAHFARAVMEGVVFSVRHAAGEHETRARSVRLIGGGAKSEVWSQIVADVLNVTVEVPLVSDSSFGAALLAAHSLGWYSSPAEAVERAQRVLRTHLPDPGRAALYDELFEIYLELQRATRAASHELAEFRQRYPREPRQEKEQ